MRSLETALANRGGLVPGLAQLQVGLVLLIIVAQTDSVGGGNALLQPLLWAVPPLCIGAVAFGLGFASAAARARSSGLQFLRDRMRAVVPTYAFAVLLVLLVIGPLLTNGPRRQYVTDPEAAAYLLNLLAWPRLTLPGVFEFNALPDIVNRNVWVAPFFVLMVGMMMVQRRGVRRFASPVLAVTLGFGAVLVQALDVAPNAPGDLLYLALRGDGLSAVLGATIGVTVFNERKGVALDLRIAIAAALVIGAMTFVGNAGWTDTAVFRVVAALPIAYLALYAAMRPLPLPLLARRIARCLPGLYLLGFPLQQAAVQLRPARDDVVNAMIGLAVAAVLAIAFAHLVAGRLLSSDQRSFDAANDLALAQHRAPRWLPRANCGTVLGYGAIMLVLIAFSLGVAAMVYLAMQPETGTN